MLETDDVVHQGRHRRPLGLGIAVGEGDRDLFVGGEDQLGPSGPAVVDQRVVQATKGRARIEGDVLDADRAQQVHHQVGAIARRRRHGKAPYVGPREVVKAPRQW